MFKKNFTNNSILILTSLIPLSIIVGASVSAINIFLISLLFLFFFINKKFFFILKDNTVLCFLIIYFYLFFNSFISIDAEVGIYRNIGFIRFLLLFLAINFFFSNYKNPNLIFKSWMFVILTVVFDSFIEIIFGKNILGYGIGYGNINGNRIVSFFKDESIVASFINGFVFILIGFLFNNYEKKIFKEKFLIYLIVLLFLFCVVFTGERSNTIKFIFGLFIFFSLNHHIKFKFKLLTIFFTILLLSITYMKSDWVKYRYGSTLFSQFTTEEKRAHYMKHNVYFYIYKSGFEVFKNHPYFGVGNKNYRVETCKASNFIEKPIYFCVTHPHQIYIELLSEHGLFGSILRLSILFILMFKNLKLIILSKNLIQIGSLIYLMVNFVPLIPGGAFFNDYNQTLFWLNLSIFYASNPKTNIFNKFNKHID